MAHVGGRAAWRMPATIARGAVLAVVGAGAIALAVLAGRIGVGRNEAIAGAMVLAALAGAIALLWPVLDERLVDAPMAHIIAFVGCDGSGKSTLTNDIHAELRDGVAIRVCYLGLGSGATGERIKRLPLIGTTLERRLAANAEQTRTHGQQIPGLMTALAVYLFSLARLRRFRRMLALRRAGIAVLTDRYPQTDVAGFYDGPGLSAASAGSRAVAALARRERRIYAWMASFRPSVVIRLNIDVETAAARKPDHGIDLLRRKVAVTPQLRFAGARIVDLDATLPYASVRAAAAHIVRATLDAAA